MYLDRSLGVGKAVVEEGGEGGVGGEGGGGQRTGATITCLGLVHVIVVALEEVSLVTLHAMQYKVDQYQYYKVGQYRSRYRAARRRRIGRYAGGGYQG